jgi:hypothetical protein
MPEATPEALTQLLGQQAPADFTTEDRLNGVMSIVSAMVRAYTRGEGFTDGVPAEDLQAVILTATARLLLNPSQIPFREQMGAFSVDYRGDWIGWTLPELAVLNSYRERAM